MAEKKRKTVVSAPAPPTKKTKKTPASEPTPSSKSVVSDAAQTPSASNDTVTKSRSSRKRAADFLGDDETQSAPPIGTTEAAKQIKKSRKSPASQPVPAASTKGAEKSLTADGVNGVIENKDDPEVDIATANEVASTYLEAEGLRTAEKLLEDENAGLDESEDEDQGAALLAGFDSDSEDSAEDQGDMSKTQAIPQFKKTNKKLKQAKEKGSDGPGTVYVGRIPHGFYEHQMRDYFTQFGNITRLRLSRNRRTGASKHFAFIEFESDEVAKIVADTMDNYLMFGHILKCKYAPSENLHPDVWKGANKKYRKIPHEKLERKQLEAPKTQEQWTKKNAKEQKKRQQQAEKMKAIGYEYTVPELKDPASVVEQRKLEQAHGIPEAVQTSEAEPNAMAAAPAIPTDEVAMKKEKELKKSKKSKGRDGVQELLTQGNLNAKDAGPAAESAKIAQNASDKKENIASVDTAPIPAAAPVKKTKKGKEDVAESEQSTHGDYDNLSSVQVGSEAAPATVTDAVPDPDVESESIFTHNGVADTILAGRKSDRKKAKGGKSISKQAKATVSDMAPGAVSRLEAEKGNKLKGVLKKGRKA